MAQAGLASIGPQESANRSLASVGCRVNLIPRFFYPIFASDEGLEAIRTFLVNSGITEVLLFTGSLQADPNYFAEDEMAKRCARIKHVIAELAAMGVEANINVECTIGHHSGSCDSQHFPFSYLVDASGAVSDSCACPLDRGWQDYVCRLYKGLAGTGARKIFVDDDFRYDWHAKNADSTDRFWNTCFCPEHLARLAERFGRSLSREELARGLRNGDRKLRQTWYELRSSTLLDVADMLRDAVHSVDPTCRLGLMNTFAATARRDRNLPELLHHMAGNNRPLLRPAQGYYSDRDRLGLLYGLGETLLALGVAAPDTEVVIEIDGGTPYNKFNKSSRMLFDMQARANVGCGFTDLTLNVFDDCHVCNFIASDHRLYLENGAAHALDRVASNISGSNELLGVGMIVGTGPVFPEAEGPDDNRQREAMVTLWRLGVPLTASRSNVSVLTRGSVQGTDLDEVFGRGGVLVDADAAREICDAGRADLLGISGVAEITSFSREVINRDVLNGVAAGSEISTGHSIACDHVVKLLADDSSCRALGRIIGFYGEDLGPSAIVHTDGDRRVVTLAHSLAATAAFVTSSRQEQVFSLLRWLSLDTVPVLVHGAVDVTPFLLRIDDGCLLTLLNLSLDAAVGFSISFGHDLECSVLRDLDGVAQTKIGRSSGRSVVEGMTLGSMSIHQVLVG